MTHWSGQRIEGANVKMDPRKRLHGESSLPTYKELMMIFVQSNFREVATHWPDKMCFPESPFFLQSATKSIHFKTGFGTKTNH